MIIISDKPGQLGNQLWAYSNMIALAKECNAKICITLKREYYDMLDTRRIKSSEFVKLYPDDSFVAKRIKWATGFLLFRLRTKGFLAWILKQLPITIIDDYVIEEKFKSIYKKYHIYFFNSWEQRKNNGFYIKNRLFIQQLILPHIEIANAVNDKMKILKNKEALIIGVHIRRGDYKNFMGGIYFYEDNIYAWYMKQMLSILSPKKVLFYIFSNELIDLKNFENLPVHFNKDTQPVYDLWAMSQCSYILGPISSFSMWASFWEKVPLYFISEPNKELSLRDFKPMIAIDVFEG